ncbi:hydrolase [Thioalkalivibrio sp. ALJ24]|uniref:hydrolase n=1 Tax=Thioalkalivibrio sp. ALJ24 TaxID=545276 RepID=UPI00037AB40F|nr:hydrolase [Thioalkalivibrio sp. ALJ24]
MSDPPEGKTDPAFRPAWWLPGRHAQTVFPALFRAPPPVRLEHERLELPDGDFLELAWGPPGRGLVLVGHGLGGDETSGYALGVVAALARRGIGSAVLISRGAGSHPNRLRRSYHAAAWDDLDHVVETLHRRDPARPMAVCGFSLSGSMLLSWLGERGDMPLATAVAVSVPFDLAASADALERGFARVYQWHLMRGLRRVTLRKFAARDDAPLPLAELRRMRRLREFDERITAPLHGFRDSADYYARASCRPRLGAIRQPTLILHAADDPFVPATSVPATRELGPGIGLELQARGGHVGFVAGDVPGRPRYWLDTRIADHISAHLEAALNTGAGR